MRSVRNLCLMCGLNFEPKQKIKYIASAQTEGEMPTTIRRAVRFTNSIKFAVHKECFERIISDTVIKEILERFELGHVHLR